jgi:peptidoglycan-associated lipoprotein
MKKTILLILIAFGLCFAGCSSKKTVVQPEQPLQQAPATQTTAPSKDAMQRIPDSRYSERITDTQLAKIDTKEETPKYLEEKGKFEDIHFDYDQYDIRPDAQPVLQTVASWLLKNTSAKILVEGHSDDRGTNEYNLALGDRRSKAVRDYLVALGIGSDRIETISYGEEEPLCTAVTEECWTKNRRAHFIILKEAGK